MKKMISSMVCLFIIIAISSCGETEKQLTDQEILVILYEAMNGPNWEGSRGDNWLSELPIGEWEGVKTNDEGRVTSLRIKGKGVEGLIPPETGGLTELKELYIDSQVYDTYNVIPPEIGKLTNLVVLGIGGSVSKEFGRADFPDISTLVNLEKLYVNNLEGEIPNYISQLKKLILIDIDGFKGPIPASIGELPVLETLLLRTYNTAEGEVPASIKNLSTLKDLRIDYTSGLTGKMEQPDAKFPEWVWDMTNLEMIFMRSLSNTGGPIPADKVANMKNLKKITIIECGLSGEIPAELFALENLADLSIYKNNLTGTIPTEIGNCAKLSTLDLSHNKLTGTIPAELGKCEKLSRVDLSGNELSTNIPEAVKAHPKFGSFKF